MLILFSLSYDPGLAAADLECFASCLRSGLNFIGIFSFQQHTLTKHKAGIRYPNPFLPKI